jgi:nitrite reductase/ring-hydroxylating ferredoxin subunit
VLAPDHTPLKVIRVRGGGDLADGELRSVQAGGRNLAVVRVGDERFACANRCLHYGVRLSDGRLEGSVVECRWHHWRYDLATGSVQGECDSDCGGDTSPFSSFETYRVFAQGDDLLVDPVPRTPLRKRSL